MKLALRSMAVLLPLLAGCTEPVSRIPPAVQAETEDGPYPVARSRSLSCWMTWVQASDDGVIVFFKEDRSRYAIGSENAVLSRSPVYIVGVGTVTLPHAFIKMGDSIRLWNSPEDGCSIKAIMQGEPGVLTTSYFHHNGPGQVIKQFVPAMPAPVR